MTARELFIVGTSGLAREAAQLARQMDPDGARWTRCVYVAQDASRLGESLSFGDIGATDEQLIARDILTDVVIGVGYPAVRRAIASRLAANPALRFPNLIHPRVELDPAVVSLGQGNMITRGVVMTCDIRLGDFNLVNWNSTVGHDVDMGSFNVINPASSLSGQVVIGDACLLGTGCRILEGLDIASDVTIGAGAVVTRSIAEPGTYIGIPARRLRGAST